MSQYNIRAGDRAGAVEIGGRELGAKLLLLYENRNSALRVVRAEGPELFARLLANASYLREGLRQLGLDVVEPGRLADGTVATTPIAAHSASRFGSASARQAASAVVARAISVSSSICAQRCETAW